MRSGVKKTPARILAGETIMLGKRLGGAIRRIQRARLGIWPAIFLAGAFLLAAASPAWAQFTVVSATITDPNGLPYANGTISIVLVTPGGSSPTLNGLSFTGSFSVNLDSTGSFSQRLADNNVVLPAATQWKFTVNCGLGCVPPASGLGPQTFSVTLTITGASQDIGPTLRAAALPLARGVTAGGISGPNVFDASGFGVKSDGKACFASAVTVTNGSTTVSCSTATFTVLDVGKTIFGTNGGGGQSNFFSGAVTLPQGTISSVTNSTTVVASVAATASCLGGANCVLVWGTPFDTQLSNAETAWAGQSTCSTLLVPAGLTLIAQPHFNSPGGGCTGSTTTMDLNSAVRGWGPGTSFLVMVPNFNLAACNAGANPNGCFFGYNQAVVADLAIWGAGFGATGNNSKTLISPGVGSWFFNFSCVGFGAGDTSLIGMTVHDGFLGNKVLLDGCGATGLQVTAGTGPIATAGGSANYCLECNVQDNRLNNLTVAANGVFIDYGTSWGGTNASSPLLDISGTYYGIGSYAFQRAGGAALIPMIRIESGGTAYLTNGIWNADFPTGPNSDAVDVLTGGTLFAQGTIFKGRGAPSFSIGPSGASGTFNDLGGNLFQTNAGVAGFGGTGAVASSYSQAVGSCSGVGTAASTLFVLGPGATTSTCTITTETIVRVMDRAGTLSNLSVTASAGGVNGSSGVVTVRKNAAATTLTCTLGTGTSCQDATHTVAYAVGDRISINFTTQAADTLANVAATVWAR